MERSTLRSASCWKAEVQSPSNYYDALQWGCRCKLIRGCLSSACSLLSPHAFNILTLLSGIREYCWRPRTGRLFGIECTFLFMSVPGDFSYPNMPDFPTREYIFQLEVAYSCLDICMTLPTLCYAIILLNISTTGRFI